MSDFVNAVVELHSLLCPEDLLKRLQALEKAMGRLGGHNEPGVLDIDIVAIGDYEIRTGRLTVPHPRYQQRLFVLLPLKEIAPEFKCPVTGTSVDDMLGAIDPGQVVTQISTRQIIPTPTRSPGQLHHV
jgi:2-amino-4-hydroxy-6-hydroxymethyldihydropteridine diphosphokinase